MLQLLSLLRGIEYARHPWITHNGKLDEQGEKAESWVLHRVGVSMLNLGIGGMMCVGLLATAGQISPGHIDEIARDTSATKDADTNTRKFQFLVCFRV